MRQIVLDTETTGIDPKQGHRIIEVGCIELVNRRFTGKQFHCYINPERLVDEGAYRVHGIGNEFLADKPVFARIADELLAFIRGAQLVIHNAPFDVGFLDHEFNLLAAKYGRVKDHCSVLDTLKMAREKHPGQKNNLDALCKRYEVDNSNRELHGALLDANILAHVYLAMTREQGTLFGTNEHTPKQQQSHQQAPEIAAPTTQRSWDIPVIKADEAETRAHEQLLALLADH